MPNRRASFQNVHQWGWMQSFKALRRSQGEFELTDQQALNIFMLSENEYTPNEEAFTLYMRRYARNQ
jgi:hypothetical protein